MEIVDIEYWLRLGVLIAEDNCNANSYGHNNNLMT
jgi:hypothetical protein